MHLKSWLQAIFRSSKEDNNSKMARNNTTAAALAFTRLTTGAAKVRSDPFVYGRAATLLHAGSKTAQGTPWMPKMNAEYSFLLRVTVSHTTRNNRNPRHLVTLKPFSGCGEGNSPPSLAAMFPVPLRSLSKHCCRPRCSFQVYSQRCEAFDIRPVLILRSFYHELVPWLYQSKLDYISTEVIYHTSTQDHHHF